MFNPDDAEGMSLSIQDHTHTHTYMSAHWALETFPTSATAVCHLLGSSQACGRHLVSLSVRLAPRGAGGTPLLHVSVVLSRCTGTDGGAFFLYVLIMVTTCVLKIDFQRALNIRKELCSAQADVRLHLS